MCVARPQEKTVTQCHCVISQSLGSSSAVSPLGSDAGVLAGLMSTWYNLESCERTLIEKMAP